MNENKKDGTLGVDIYATGKGRIIFDMRFDDCRKKFDMSLEDAVDFAKNIADKCKEEVEMQLIKGFLLNFDAKRALVRNYGCLFFFVRTPVRVKILSYYRN